MRLPWELDPNVRFKFQALGESYPQETFGLQTGIMDIAAAARAERLKTHRPSAINSSEKPKRQLIFPRPNLPVNFGTMRS
jgi:hypothetical protein